VQEGSHAAQVPSAWHLPDRQLFTGWVASVQSGSTSPQSQSHVAPSANAAALHRHALGTSPRTHAPSLQ
jgi:hypothetical protein